MVNRANCPNMVEEGRCAIPWEIQRHHISKSHHIMKLLERTLDGKIRKGVEQELWEEQQGFRKGKGGLMGCLH